MLSVEQNYSFPLAIRNTNGSIPFRGAKYYSYSFFSYPTAPHMPTSQDVEGKLEAYKTNKNFLDYIFTTLGVYLSVSLANIL